MFSRTAIFALTSALYFGKTVLADTTFAGCFLNDGRFDEAVDPTAAATPEICAASCSTFDFYQYSATFTNTNNVKQCRCLTSYPAGTALGTGTQGSCTAPFDVRTISTTFGFIDCASTVTFNSDGQTSATVSSPKDCYDQCRSQYVAVFWKDSNDNYNCQCGTNGLNDYDAVNTCATNSYFIYNHPAAAKASGLARRRERLERAHARSFSFCPSGSTACKVSPVGDEYECIDTSAELESCGGCLYGEVGNSTSIAGQE
ncbi:hypothetical protein I317_04708 [Kwoniella heveanensis CBS 569]|nr:hypothetical protein I317_04708 [Kwoniella heveanensis CBS 569]